MTNNNPVNSVPLLDVGRGNNPLKAELLGTIGKIIDSGQFVGGPWCRDFELAMAETCQTRHAIGCASGSDALLLALMVHDIGPGDEVICPSFTFFATASAVARLGAVPVFVDIDPFSFNMDARLIASAITEKTRAIIPVHLFGQCCDMAPIMELAREHDLFVIEDAAQAIGASYRGKPAGSIGDVGCFSFYPTKNLGGFGDGGLLTTNSAEIADRLRLIANHGMRPRYHHLELGINSRLDSIQAAVLGIKIRHLTRWSEARAANAAIYRRKIAEAGLNSDVLLPISVHANSIHVWNQFTVRITGGQRDDVRQQLTDAKVGTEVYYPIPLHRQKCFSHLSCANGNLPHTDRAAAEVLSLPIFPELTADEIDRVVHAIARAVRSQHAGLPVTV